MHRTEVLGCPVDAISEEETIDLVFRWRDGSERKSHTIITINVAMLMMMKSDPKLAHAIEQADLVIIDGKPLIWSGKWLGAPPLSRVPGVHLMQRLLEVGGDRQLRIFLLGTKQDRLDKLVGVIQEQYPRVTIAGSRNGYFKPADYPEITRMVRESNADLLLVGMPVPFKEIWCEEHREELCTPAILGVGGAFDVLAGYVPRAPHLVQEVGMEWAWRLAMEPRKLWKRYLVTNSQFFVLLTKELVAKRAAKTG